MNHMYSPQQFGQLIGRTTNTLQKWDREGTWRAHRNPLSNRRYPTHDQYLRGLVAQEQGLTIVSTRVSSPAQKPDLAKQIKAMRRYSEQHALQVDRWLSDIGSGLNSKRRHFNQLMELVELGQVRRVFLAHWDQLVRFGSAYFEACCQRHQTELIVITGEAMLPEHALVRDLIAIGMVFSARLPGLRSSKNVLKDAAFQKE